MWSGRRLTKIQATTRPDHVWPEVWTKIGKAAQNREKQEWAKEKPKLDNARRLRGIYFIDPDDEEYREIYQKREEKTGRLVAPAMPCERTPNGITNVTAKAEDCIRKNSKTVYGCIVESHESTRQRVESSQPKNHEDHIAGKGFTSMSHYNLVHKFIPMPQAMKIPDAKAAVDKEWKKVETIPAWKSGKSQEQKGCYSGSTKETKRKSTLPH